MFQFKLKKVPPVNSEDLKILKALTNSDFCLNTKKYFFPPGTNYIQQFCMSAVNAVVSPFVLYDIALEAAHVLARNNPTIAQNHLRSTILNPIIQKCLQM